MSSNQVPKTNPYLTPSYLLTLSSHIQTLSQFYQQENLPSLSIEYKSFLQSTFNNLANNLTVFSQDQTMLISSLLSTKVQLQSFVGQKLFYLLYRQTEPLAEIVKFIIQGYKQNTEQYEEILMSEKKRKVQWQQQKNDKVISNLKKEVVIKRQYVKQLQERVKDLQEENSRIYQKIIDNAKNTISTTLIQSKLLTGASQIMAPGKYSKSSMLSQSSPKISHKQMSLKQVEETILEILQLKRKQQTISAKRSSMKSYVRYFFKYKFGLSELCEEMRGNFLSAVRHFLSATWNSHELNNGDSMMRIENFPQQKPLLLLFQKVLDEEIDEAFFWNDYIPRGLKIIKVFKRYLNQKQRVELRQLDKLYEGYEGISGAISNYSSNKIIFNQEEKKDFELDQVDVRHILCNVYTKGKEIETLQMIFAEIIGKEHERDNWIGVEESSIIMSSVKPISTTRMVLSKHLLAIILCYEIESYCIKLTPLTNAIKKHSISSEYVTLNYTGLEKVILEMKVEEHKYLPYLQQNFIQLKDKEFSYSEVVQIIDKQLDKGDGKYLAAQTYSSRKL